MNQPAPDRRDHEADDHDPDDHDPDDHEVAARVATGAGELLVSLRQQMWDAGAHPWQVMDDGDAYAHHFIMGQLAELRPDDPVLSEEGRDGPARLSSRRAWVVDPLDGTNEYGERGRPDWAVHIALVIDGIAEIGAVALPAMGITLCTRPAPPPPGPIEGRNPRVVVSRTRRPYASMVIAEALGADLVAMGSAGAKAMAVVMGHVDVYAHAGGQYEWDSAAPVAVARSAGLHVSRIDGSPLVYNRPDPWLPDLLICRAEYAEPALDALWGDTWRANAGGA